MGRIRHTYTKRKTKELLKEAEFTRDFTKNKEILANISTIQSKKIRNVIAGYAAKLSKVEKY